MVDKEKLPINPEKKEKESTTPDIFPKKKDLNELQTKVETTHLKTEIIDQVEVKSDWSYELIKWSKMYDKLGEIGKTDIEIKEFAENIDKVVRKFLDQELDWFSNNIKNSMSVGIQFAMMETLTKQWAQWSTEFFDAFSTTKSESAGKAFEWLYKAFGTLWSANEFFVLANKVQNLTWYLSDKKNTLITSKNIPELMNPNQFKTLLSKPVWSNQVQIDKLDIATVLTLNSSNPVDIHAWEDELKKIVNNDKISGVITEKSITAIEKSLQTADKLLDTREKYKGKSSELIGKIAGFLDIKIPFLGNLGEMMEMKFPTDVFGERKDRPMIDFVLGVLGFHGGVKWLHKEYIKEKLDALHIDNTFITGSYNDFQKNIDITITNESEISTRKTCALIAPNSPKETVMKAKIPADYLGLKKSMVDNLDTTKLNAVMVAKFAPEAIITENGKNIVDISKIDDKNVFVDTYLKYIIPLLADPTDDFITSKKVDKNSFALAVIGGLVGDKYFIESVNIGLTSTTDFIDHWSIEKNMTFITKEISWEITEDQKKKIIKELSTIKSPLSVEMIISSAKKYDVPLSYIMAIMKNDSAYGTTGLWAKTHNPGNVGNTDDWSSKDRWTWEDWVDAVAQNLKKRIDAYHAKYGIILQPTIKELASGKKEKTGEKFFGAYMTAPKWPEIVQNIQKYLEKEGISLAA